MSSNPDDKTPSQAPWPEGVPVFDFTETDTAMAGARELYLGLIRAEFTEAQACRIVANCLMHKAEDEE